MRIPGIYWGQKLPFQAIFFGYCAGERGYKYLASRVTEAAPCYRSRKSAGQMDHFETIDGRHIFIVSTDPGFDDDLVAVVSVLTHEAVHVWQAIADTIGEVRPSSEFEAYTVQHIVEELFRGFCITRRPKWLPKGTKFPRVR